MSYDVPLYVDTLIQHRLTGCSKKLVQQGSRPVVARSVHGVREHDNRPRTPLANFLRIPLNVALQAIDSHPHQLMDHRRNPIQGTYRGQEIEYADGV